MSTLLEKVPVFTGIYGIPEAAKYLSNTHPLTNGHKVDPGRLRYWIRTSVPLIAPSPFPTRQRFITFLDLISMRMIAVLRSRNVKLHEIRNTEKYLRKEFGLRWPFATRQLWTCNSHVFIEFEEYLLTASKFGQRAMDFIKEWLTSVDIDMTFDKNDIATSWYPYKHICLDPTIQFGAPCIDETRIPTRSLWNKIKAGDNIEVVAALYDLSTNEVQSAIQWEKRIGTT